MSNGTVYGFFGMFSPSSQPALMYLSSLEGVEILFTGLALVTFAVVAYCVYLLLSVAMLLRWSSLCVGRNLVMAYGSQLKSSVCHRQSTKHVFLFLVSESRFGLVYIHTYIYILTVRLSVCRVDPEHC